MEVVDEAVNMEVEDEAVDMGRLALQIFSLKKEPVLNFNFELNNIFMRHISCFFYRGDILL